MNLAFVIRKQIKGSGLFNGGRLRSYLFLMLCIMGASLAVLFSYNTALSQQDDASWSLPTALFETSGRASEAEVVADSSGVVHAFWAYAAPGSEDSDSGQAIYYARQEEGRWSEPVDILISPGGRVARMHNVVVDSAGYLHLVWSGGNALYYSRAYALEAGTGAGWTFPQALTSGVSAAEPAIAVGLDNTLFVLWTQARAGLMFVRSEDGGQSWSTPHVVFTADNDNELARWGRIAVDERGRLHVVFTYVVDDPEGRYGRTDAMLLYYLRSDDRGATWSDPFQVTPEPDFGEINIATFGEDTVHLVWNGRAGRFGRYHRWSGDGGESWSQIIEILAPAPLDPFGSGGLTGFPALVVDNAGILHMVSTTSGDRYFYWQNGIWSESVQISSGLDGRGVTGRLTSLEQPSITISEGNQLHVVFHDGFERIWYTGSVTNTPHETPIPLPMLDIVVAADVVTPIPAEISPAATVAPNLPFELAPPPARTPFSPLLASVLTVSLLVGVVVFFYGIRAKR